MAAKQKEIGANTEAVEEKTARNGEVRPGDLLRRDVGVGEGYGVLASRSV